MVERTPSIDHELCNLCQSCIAACPLEAITLVDRDQVPKPEATLVPVSRQQTEAIQVQAQPSTVALRARVLPVVAAVVVWTAREIVPRLAVYMLDSLDRRLSGSGSTSAADAAERSDVGRGGRRRRRRRGI